jgi:DNA-binding GntR family transcriptional regulator
VGPGALEPLQLPDTLAASATELLRERILSGAFLPGERLVEAEIARQLGTSRGPVREALAKLRAEGLVRDERRGAFVAELGAEDIREIYELRAALEERAARLIVLRRDREALDELAGLVEGLRRAAAADDRERFAQLDFAFHEELTRLSGNGRLHRAFVTQAGALRTLLRLEVTTQYESLEGILEEHERLFRDIASLSVPRAEAGCARHLAEALERVLGMVERSGASEARRPASAQAEAPSPLEPRRSRAPGGRRGLRG